MIFKMEIHLGNEAMQTPDDVAETLRSLAEEHIGGSVWGVHNGVIHDLNGNRVGTYWTEDDDE